MEHHRMQMNPNNRWVKKAAMIPWDTIEAEYAKLFPSHTGMPAKPLRMALGSLLIQKQYHYPDEELVEQIRENPYYQYFIGLPGYKDKIPFVPSLLVEFRKRLSEDVLNEINEMIIVFNAQQDDDDSNDGSGDAGQSDQQDSATDSENAGTLILDATCAPQNIKYIVLDPNKTFRDYINEYMAAAKQDEIQRVAEAFGLDADKLRALMQSIVTEATLNEYGRFDALLATVDRAKAKAFFEEKEGKPILPPKVIPKVSKLLRAFILRGGFDISSDLE